MRTGAAVGTLMMTMLLVASCNGESGDGGSGVTIVPGAAGQSGAVPAPLGDTPVAPTTPVVGVPPATDTDTGAGNDTPTPPAGDGDGDAVVPPAPPAEVPIEVPLPGTLGAWCQGQPENFSFFVTSMDALWALSASAPGDLAGGFGGDFRGIAGADAICQSIGSATGHGAKTWRAFLSATDDGGGNAVHAIDRIGEGPWHDANGLLVASGRDGLLSGDRPDGAPETTEDLPDECGTPISALGDAHDVVTGSNKMGQLNSDDPSSTCNDWTSTDATLGQGGGMMGLGSVMCGHSFPRMLPGGGSFGSFGGANWMSDHGLRGCTKGANVVQNGAGTGTCIGCSGGYGALYCFAE